MLGKRGQHLTEYVIMFGVVVSVTVAMQMTVSKAIGGRLKQETEAVLGVAPEPEGESSSSITTRTLETGGAGAINTLINSTSSGSSSSGFVLATASGAPPGQTVSADEGTTAVQIAVALSPEEIEEFLQELEDVTGEEVTASAVRLEVEEISAEAGEDDGDVTRMATITLRDSKKVDENGHPVEYVHTFEFKIVDNSVTKNEDLGVFFAEVELGDGEVVQMVGLLESAVSREVDSASFVDRVAGAAAYKELVDHGLAQARTEGDAASGGSVDAGGDLQQLLEDAFGTEHDGSIYGGLTASEDILAVAQEYMEEKGILSRGESLTDLSEQELEDALVSLHDSLMNADPSEARGLMDLTNDSVLSFELGGAALSEAAIENNRGSIENNLQDLAGQLKDFIAEADKKVDAYIQQRVKEAEASGQPIESMDIFGTDLVSEAHGGGAEGQAVSDAVKAAKELLGVLDAESVSQLSDEAFADLVGPGGLVATTSQTIDNAVKSVRARDLEGVEPSIVSVPDGDGDTINVSVPPGGLEVHSQNGLIDLDGDGQVDLFPQSGVQTFFLDAEHGEAAAAANKRAETAALSYFMDTVPEEVAQGLDAVFGGSRFQGSYKPEAGGQTLQEYVKSGRWRAVVKDDLESQFEPLLQAIADPQSESDQKLLEAVSVMWPSVTSDSTEVFVGTGRPLRLSDNAVQTGVEYYSANGEPLMSVSFGPGFQDVEYTLAEGVEGRLVYGDDPIFGAGKDSGSIPVGIEFDSEPGMVRLFIDNSGSNDKRTINAIATDENSSSGSPIFAQTKYEGGNGNAAKPESATTVVAAVGAQPNGEGGPTAGYIYEERKVSNGVASSEDAVRIFVPEADGYEVRHNADGTSSRQNSVLTRVDFDQIGENPIILSDDIALRNPKADSLGSGFSAQGDSPKASEPMTFESTKAGRVVTRLGESGLFGDAPVKGESMTFSQIQQFSNRTSESAAPLSIDFSGEALDTNDVLGDFTPDGLPEFIKTDDAGIQQIVWRVVDTGSVSQGMDHDSGIAGFPDAEIGAVGAVPGSSGLADGLPSVEVTPRTDKFTRMDAIRQGRHPKSYIDGGRLEFNVFLRTNEDSIPQDTQPALFEGSGKVTVFDADGLRSSTRPAPLTMDDIVEAQAAGGTQTTPGSNPLPGQGLAPNDFSLPGTSIAPRSSGSTPSGVSDGVRTIPSGSGGLNMPSTQPSGLPGFSGITDGEDGVGFGSGGGVSLKPNTAMPSHFTNPQINTANPQLNTGAGSQRLPTQPVIISPELP